MLSFSLLQKMYAENGTLVFQFTLFQPDFMSSNFHYGCCVNVSHLALVFVFWRCNLEISWMYHCLGCLVLSERNGTNHPSMDLWWARSSLRVFFSGQRTYLAISHHTKTDYAVCEQKHCRRILQQRSLWYLDDRHSVVLCGIYFTNFFKCFQELKIRFHI